MKGMRQIMSLKYTQEIIKKVAAGLIPKHEGLIKSGYKKSRFYELVKEFKINGEKVFIHKNAGNTYAVKHEPIVPIMLIELYEKEYNLCNILDFKRNLKTYENIHLPYSYLYNVLKDNNLISPLAHHKTKRLYKKNLKDSIEEKIEQESPIPIPEDKKLRAIMNMPMAQKRPTAKGAILETDGAFLKWLPNSNEVWALHGFIDVASSEPLSLIFDKEETTQGYLQAFRQVVEVHGIPQLIKTDCRRTFWSSKIRDNNPDNKVQFQYVANMLGCEISSSTAPESKPHIERLWRTIKPILPYFLKRHNVKTIDQANEILPLFIEYLKNEVMKIHPTESNVFKEYNGDSEMIFGYYEVRAIQKDMSIKFRGKKYIPCEGTQPVKLPLGRVLLVESTLGELYIAYHSQYFNLLEIDSDLLYMTKQMLIETNKENVVPKKRTPRTGWHAMHYITFMNKKSKNRI